MSYIGKTEKRLKYLYFKKLMLEIKFKEYPTNENRDKYENVCEDLIDNLSKFYADFIFTYKVDNDALFESYLALPKDVVVKSLFSNLIKKWDQDRKNADPINKQNFNIHTELKK
jgi:hypothetical protein